VPVRRVLLVDSTLTKGMTVNIELVNQIRHKLANETYDIDGRLRECADDVLGDLLREGEERERFDLCD
jgi:hypothetical protein